MRMCVQRNSAWQPPLCPLCGIETRLEAEAVERTDRQAREDAVPPGWGRFAEGVSAGHESCRLRRGEENCETA